MKLLNEYRKLHEQGKFPGMSLLPFVPEIAELVVEFKARRLLDYGCGMGRQYTRERAHVVWGVGMPTLYDPAVAQFSVKPVGRFQGVICTDVLEHVPESELDAVVREIAGHAKLWAFISVCCRPSKHIRFEDGRNVHVTVKPFAWWQEYLPPFFASNTRLVIRQTE